MYRNKPLYASAILFLLSTGCTPAERSETGEIETAGLVDAFEILVGDCFNDRITITVFSCFEIYKSSTLTYFTKRYHC